MPTFLPRFHRSAALSWAMQAVAATAAADSVTLRSHDGHFVLTGELTDMEDGAFLVRGPLGELRISAKRVVCEGHACLPAETASDLQAAAETAEVAVQLQAPPADASPADGLAVRLLESFAASQGAGIAIETLAGPSYGLRLAEDRVRQVGNTGALAGSDADETTLALVYGPDHAERPDPALWSETIAHDALAILVHPGNPVGQMTLEQLRGVYAGQIDNWSALGGPDAPIRLIGHADATTEAMDRIRRRAFSYEAALIDAELGLVDRSILRLPMDLARIAADSVPASGKGRKLAEDLRLAAAHHDKLTATLQFASGSSRLTGTAEAELARLVDHLADLPEGARVLVAGCGDEVSAQQKNRRVSLQRARTVAAGLKGLGAERLAGIAFAEKGFGGLAPVASNDSAADRALNRRVEIWIENPVQG